MLKDLVLRSSMAGHIQEPQTLQFISCVWKSKEDMDRSGVDCGKGSKDSREKQAKVVSLELSLIS